jgi:prepilin-type N-terminal cleavage/methylation domain-containing protein
MNSKKGFTLLELMIVLLLCAFIARLGIIQLSFLDRIIIRTELDKVVAVCNYLQQLALNTNKEHYLLFNLQDNSYSFGGYKESLPVTIAFGILPAIKGPPGSPYQLIERPITFAHNSICFYPTGIISSGTVYIIDKKKQIQYALSNSVSQISHIRMYYYDNGWKLCSNKK